MLERMKAVAYGTGRSIRSGTAPSLQRVVSTEKPPKSFQMTFRSGRYTRRMLTISIGRRLVAVAAPGAFLLASVASAQSIDVRVVQPERRDIVRLSAQPATAEGSPCMASASISASVPPLSRSASAQPRRTRLLR